MSLVIYDENVKEELVIYEEVQVQNSCALLVLLLILVIFKIKSKLNENTRPVRTPLETPQTQIQETPQTQIQETPQTPIETLQIQIQETPQTPIEIPRIPQIQETATDLTTVPKCILCNKRDRRDTCDIYCIFCFILIFGEEETKEEEPETDVPEFESEPGSKKILLYTKPPQSGKTHGCIVVPTTLAYLKGEFTFIGLPNNSAFENQTTGRLCKGVDVDFLDTEIISQQDYELVKNNPKCFKANEIGVWNISSKHTLDDSVEILENIKNKNMKSIVFIRNTRCLANVIMTINEILKHTDININIILDEVHGFFGLIKIPDNFDYEAYNNDVISYIENGNKQPHYSTYKVDVNNSVIWILNTFKNSNRVNITSMTATTSSICKNSEELEKLDIEIVVKMLKIPDCYVGYHECIKNSYNGDISGAFKKILNTQREEAYVMCHSGYNKKTHVSASKSWGTECIRAGIDKNLICSMTDNTNGFCVYDYRGVLTRSYAKIHFNEPSEFLKVLKRSYKFIGIFGDTCMCESATYQNPNLNIQITDLVVPKFKNKSMTGMFKIQQKIGRLYANDTRNNRPDRNIWFHGEDRKKFESSKGLEINIQKDSLVKSITEVDYKKHEYNAKHLRIDAHGSEIKFKQDIDTDIIRKRFKMYQKYNKDSNESRFIKSINSYETYSHEQLIKELKDCGYEKPGFILTTFSKKLMNNNTINRQFYLDKTGDSYRFSPEIADAHNEIFGY